MHLFLKKFIFCLVLFVITIKLIAGTMGDIRKHTNIIFNVSGGPAFSSDVGSNQYFSANDNIFTFFNYKSDHSNQTQGIWGVFTGAEFLVNSLWLLQSGVSYYQPYFEAKGIVTQGVDVATQNQYSYKYEIRPHQLLAEGKLLYQYQHNLYPYLSLGLGVSWNNADNYKVNIQPPFTTFSNQFANNSIASFSYLLGLGADYALAKNMRIGLGYRFTDFGKVETGTATIDNVYTGYRLSQSHLYVNILEAQLTLILM